MQKSLGLIETQGLAGGIEAADAAVKSANVELIGYEFAKGGGWTTIKVQGDVGAVKAAVDAAKIAAAKVNRVVSTKVIARPSDSLEMLIRNDLTVGYTPPPPEPPKGPEPPESPVKPDEPVKEEAAQIPVEESVKPEPVVEAEEPEAKAEPKTVPEVSVDEVPADTPILVEAEETPVEESQAAEAAKAAKKAAGKKGGKRKQ